jgi:uncharacterized protein
LKDSFITFDQLLRESLVEARESLARTPEKLKILAQSNVVDAGAKGFVIFLEGISDFFQKGNIQTGNVKKVLGFKNTSLEQDDVVLDEHGESEFRYCTEALISLKSTGKDEIRTFLESKGDSVVIAGPESRMRIHVHTNQPSDIFAHLADHCTILYQKVDDMVQQNEVAHRRKYKIALVVDSTCDLPKEIIEQYQINVVPLNVFFGESQFLDRLTITQDKFFHLLETSDVYPTSSQPSIKDITNTFNYLSTHYDSIIAVHISDILSGTYANSRKAAENISNETGKRIDVLNSRTTSGCAGLMALRIAQAIEQSKTHEQIIRESENWTTEILVGSQSLKSFIKGGRVSPAKGFIGKLLNTKPIVTITPEGRALLYDKAFSYKGSLNKILGHARKSIEKKPLWNYCIVHAKNPESVQWIAKEMEALTGKKPVYTMEISPVLAISAGMGVAAICLMQE